MKKYYVYELFDTYGNIMYVGETTNPKERLYGHIHRRRNMDFFHKQLSINVVAEYENRTDALRHEDSLKEEYGLPRTEWERHLKRSRAGGQKNKESGHMAALGKMYGGKRIIPQWNKSGGAASMKILYNCGRCGKSGYGARMAGHINKGTKKCNL